VLTGIAKMARDGAVLDQKTLVEYIELPTRSYISRCRNPAMPFEWMINPYRGCEFGCKYCYARYTHEFMEFHDSAAFERKIFAKLWDEAAFRREIDRFPYGTTLAIGTATDPYQPAERRYRVTRRMLEVFASRKGWNLSITTKSNLVERDLEVYRRLMEHNRLTVNMTVTTTDAKLARLLEPMAPRPDLRLQAVQRLTLAGVPCGVFAIPIVPGITDSAASIEAVIQAAAESGAQYFGANLLFLQPCALRVFIPFLEKEFPALADAYLRRFSRYAYLRGAYAERIHERVVTIRERYGLKSRPVEKQLVPGQLSLDFRG